MILPITCPGCGGDRAPSQTYCPTCHRHLRVNLNYGERTTAFWIVEHLGQAMKDADSKYGTFLITTGLRLYRGKQPSIKERLWFGMVVCAWCFAVEEVLDMRHKHAETLYRKLWGHDRRTMSQAPFPPLT